MYLYISHISLPLITRFNNGSQLPDVYLVCSSSDSNKRPTPLVPSMSSSSVSSPSPITRTNHLPQRLKRELFDTIVHIAVGPKKELFRLHKGLLCSASPFFRAALEGKFVESKTQAIDMPEEDVVMFRYLQMWLYTDSFLEGGEEASAVPWHTLINIYGQCAVVWK